MVLCDVKCSVHIIHNTLRIWKFWGDVNQVKIGVINYDDISSVHLMMD